MKINRKAFTLLEVMVVVAIISIMSVSVVIGFNAFGQTIKVQETLGVIEDLIKKLEVEVTENEFQENNIHFKKDFLIVETKIKNTAIELNYKGLGSEGCAADQVALEIKNTNEVVYLNKKDLKGNNMEILPFKTDEIQCINFLNSRETGFQYQAYSSSGKSNLVRLFHFNLNRSSLTESVQIVKGTEYSLKIIAPYAKKEVYKNNLENEGPLSLLLKNQEGDEKELILKN